MFTIEHGTRLGVQDAETWFYSHYAWCLNPILTVRELFSRLREECERYGSLNLTWQREESAINIYLFACAISCTADDYLAFRPLPLSSLGAAPPSLRTMLSVAEKLVNLPFALLSDARHGLVRTWRARWTEVLELACHHLLAGADRDGAVVARIRESLRDLEGARLPEDFLRRRMKLNEGFRCQDLTHHDIIALTEKYCQAHPAQAVPQVIVIGPRTAGAYFAPLVQAHLRMRGYADVKCVTVRPKKGLSRLETHEIRRALAAGAHAMLTDDYSNSGDTLRSLMRVLRRFGARAGDVSILAPIHAAQPVVRFAEPGGAEIFTLQHPDLYKTHCMEPQSILPLFREYFEEKSADTVTLEENGWTKETNERLWKHYPDGFNVRLKRAFDVRFRSTDRILLHQRVFVKSVGWGWLGYHAFLAGRRLEPYVPGILGLRNGLLFTEWIDGQPEDLHEKSEERLERISSYVARRVSQLALAEDTRFEAPDRGWGWGLLLQILQRSYGVRLGYLKRSALLRRLLPARTPCPTLIDGHLRPEEFLVTESGTVKIDFEHHNFGAPNLDIVDPAFDLASASFEFKLSDAEEEKLISHYSIAIGDQGVFDRLILQKLLYATHEERRALEMLRSRQSAIPLEAWNQRYLSAWNSRVFAMNKLCSSMILAPKVETPDGPLVFLDLDGVLDSEILGFPHTTPSGILALSLLRSEGFCLVTNTGRSIKHVRNYCSHYGFSGGVAEYGSVFLNFSRGTEIPLTGAEVSDQLNRIRIALRKIPGVFLDSGYQYAVRAYRFDSRGTCGLDPKEAGSILEATHADKLKFIARGADTYFVGRDTSKGDALKFVADRLGLPGQFVAAIGDSDEDVSMLRAADRSFAPRNGSAQVRSLARRRKCHLDSRERQRGLLHIAEILVGVGKNYDREMLIERGAESTVRRMMYDLLEVAEQGRRTKILSLLRPRVL
ncbi:MAG TPA: HAD hydrolase family protein [Bacteroidota bacterium]|nr:HAD hydrolase family protein [Bacteroidota bacterium]